MFLKILMGSFLDRLNFEYLLLYRSLFGNTVMYHFQSEASDEAASCRRLPGTFPAHTK